MANPRLTIYPLGNADCCLLNLPDDRVVVIDYAATRGDARNDKRIDLAAALKKDLGSRKSVDVLALSHLDRDHYVGASAFFELKHSKKYQGGNRIAIEQLWVPAAVILEEGLEAEEAKVIQAEARYRLLEGKSIRVFSRPETLDDWLKKRGIRPSDRRHLITDAGNVIPGFDSTTHSGQFFVHSPFAEAAKDGKKIIRNSTSLVLHLTFEVGGRRTCVFFGADIQHEDLSKIVTITESNSNQDRLKIDVAKLPHHCSYLSLGPKKGSNKTEPDKPIKRLYEDYTQNGVVLVSSSDPIPAGDTDDPPHRQAANYYKGVTRNRFGEFKVTMEHPKQSKPERLVIHIGNRGASIKKATSIAAPIISQPARRAGS